MTFTKIKNRNITVVSYYTDKYEGEARKLWESVKDFDFDVYIEHVKDQGSWLKNVNLKPFFLREVIDDISTDLLYVDADATFEGYPYLFKELLPCDFAYHYFKDCQVASGTLFIKNNNHGRKILDEWCWQVDDCPTENDQNNLYESLKKVDQEIVMTLPAEYCYIFDANQAIVGDPVIKHWQASRRFRDA